MTEASPIRPACVKGEEGEAEVGVGVKGERLTQGHLERCNRARWRIKGFGRKAHKDSYQAKDQDIKREGVFTIECLLDFSFFPSEPMENQPALVVVEQKRASCH